MLPTTRTSSSPTVPVRLKIEFSGRAHSSAVVCRCAVVDSDGDGLVHVDDIVRNFRSHAHPEVAGGSREEEDVRREFLESFSGKLGHHQSAGGLFRKNPSPIEKGADQHAKDPRGLAVRRDTD